MVFRRKQWILGMVLGVAAWAFPAAPARAELRVTFSDLTGPTTGSLEAIDGGAFDADGTVNNSIRFIQTVGDIDVNAAVASTNVPGTSPVGFVKINSGDVTNLATSSQSLSIFTTATGFTAPAGGVVIDTSEAMTVDVAPAPGVTASFQSFIDPNNALYGTTIASAIVTVNGKTGDSVSANVPVEPETLNTTYSVSNRAIYTIPGSSPSGAPTKFSALGTTNVRPDTGVIPGPGGLSLALAGLPFISAAWLRRRRK
jgi:hypothetical protein